MSKTQKNILNICYAIYAITLIVSMVVCFMNNNMGGFMMGVVAIVTPFLVPVFLKICKLKATFEILLINIIFVYIASIIGSVIGGYSIPYFDKMLHSSSGLFITMLGYMLYSCLKKSTQIKEFNEQVISIVFINAFNMMVAVFWEFFEFAMLVFFNNDGINHYTSGVYDCMTDMLVAFVGGLIITGFVINYYRSDKKNFWIQLNENFYHTNFEG